MESPIASMFEAFALKNPNHPALYYQGKTYSYGALLDLVRSIQKTIEHNIPQKGCVIAIADELNDFTYAGILAISLSGNVVLPFKPDMAPERIKYIFESAPPVCVLYSDLQKDKINLQFPFLHEYAQLVMNYEAPQWIAAPQPPVYDTTYHEMVYILFTSGSTGKPKGVPITRKNLMDYLSFFLDKNNYDFNPQDRFLQVFDFTFDVAYFSLFVPLSVGATCYALDNKPGRIKFLEIIQMLKDHDITVVSMVPTVLLFLKKYLSRISLPHLRYSFFSGDILYHDTAANWKKCFPNGHLHNSYGPTETTIQNTRYIWEEKQSEIESHNNIVPIGKPFPGVHYVILDEEGKRVPEGETGELCFYGNQVIDAYVGHEHEHMFINVEIEGRSQRCYKTGDLSSLNQYGNLIFHGRKDFQCKINGYRIEIPEIEKVLYEIAKTPVAIVAKRNAEGLNYLIGFIEASTMTEEELKSEMKRFLPEYMIPAHLIMLDAIPLNDNNKIDRKYLSQNFS